MLLSLWSSSFLLEYLWAGFGKHAWKDVFTGNHHFTPSHWLHTHTHNHFLPPLMACWHQQPLTRPFPHRSTVTVTQLSRWHCVELHPSVSSSFTPPHLRSWTPAHPSGCWQRRPAQVPLALSAGRVYNHLLMAQRKLNPNYPLRQSNHAITRTLGERVWYMTASPNCRVWVPALQ